MFDFVLKGGNASQLEKDIGSDMFPANEHYFGLVNVSFNCSAAIYNFNLAVLIVIIVATTQQKVYFRGSLSQRPLRLI